MKKKQKLQHRNTRLSDIWIPYKVTDIRHREIEVHDHEELERFREAMGFLLQGAEIINLLDRRC